MIKRIAIGHWFAQIVASNKTASLTISHRETRSCHSLALVVFVNVGAKDRYATNNASALGRVWAMTMVGNAGGAADA